VISVDNKGRQKYMAWIDDDPYHTMMFTDDDEFKRVE
jgi:hypothetical protein